jgi:hypothetical protein
MPRPLPPKFRRRGGAVSPILWTDPFDGPAGPLPAPWVDFGTPFERDGAGHAVAVGAQPAIALRDYGVMAAGLRFIAASEVSDLDNLGVVLGFDFGTGDYVFAILSNPAGGEYTAELIDRTVDPGVTAYLYLGMVPVTEIAGMQIQCVAEGGVLKVQRLVGDVWQTFEGATTDGSRTPALVELPIGGALTGTVGGFSANVGETPFLLDWAQGFTP